MTNFTKIGIIGMAVIGTIGTVVAGVIFASEQSKAVKKIAEMRSDEDKALVNAAGQAREAYNNLKAAEATKEVPVVIDINTVSWKLSPISMRSSSAVSNLRRMNNGIVSGTTFKEAFEGIQDTEEPVKDILRKAREEAVLKARTPEDLEVIRNYKDVTVKVQELYAKERGMVPGFFGCMHSWVIDHRKHMPKLMMKLLLELPIIPVIFFAYLYVSKVSDVVNSAYRYEAIK